MESDDDDMVLYVPLLMRPWTMDLRGEPATLAPGSIAYLPVYVTLAALQEAHGHDVPWTVLRYHGEDVTL